MTTEEQAISVFFQARGEIRDFISIYFVAIAALLGWLFTHSGLQMHYRIFLAVAFILLAALNALGIWYSFQIIEAARLDLEAISAAAENPNIVKQINELFYSGLGFLGFHIVVDALMVALIFWDKIARLWNWMKNAEVNQAVE